VQQRPNDINYLVEYGLLLLESDETEAAMTIGERAIQLAPDDPRGYVIKGRALMYDDPAEAIQTTIRGQEADELHAPLLAIQGVAYTNLGRYQEGIRQSIRAVELAPNDPFVLRATFTPLVYVARYQEAAEYLEQAISLNPNLTAPYFELASLYRIQRPEIFQPEMAVALYNRILEIDPNNARAYLRLCQTYANVPEADFSLAQPFCETAIEMEPDFGDAYMTLGRMQYLRRNYEGSIESFERCVALGSEEIECWYLRGLAHFLLGNCETAWDLLTESQQRVETMDFVPQGTIDDIEIGLFNIKELCPGFSNVQLPTPIPPTPIPPTPIGGF
jgi:tetratricopeptide (TPR) repeat protein